MEPKNKIALITGGSRGLGKNAAFKIAHKGFNVIVTYRSKQEEAEAVGCRIEANRHQSGSPEIRYRRSKHFCSFLPKI